MSKENKYPVITISREYYAGGRSVAKRLSELLGIPWHDYDLTKLTAQISGYAEDEVLNEEEEISKLENAIEKMLSGANFYTSSHDEINSAQHTAILELAKSPCIIVGRGANVILKTAGIESFDVFLYAAMEDRIERTMKARNIDEEEAKKFLEKHDSFRKLYYSRYSGGQHGDAREYSLCINTSAIEYDECAQIIAGILDKKF